MIVLTPVAGEKYLSALAVTGAFASEMATIAAQNHVVPWCGYIARKDGHPVGYGGFKGDPDAKRAVEIGYLTFPMHERTGVAKAIAAELVRIARENGATAAIAHTLCKENPSTGVLRANGFVRDGNGHDEGIGVVWRWLLQL